MISKIKIVVIFLLILVSACTTNQPIQESETIKIGSIFILSGVGSSWGTQSLQGAQLAVKDLNAQGGINGKQIELIVEDNPGDDAKSAVSALQKLMDEGVQLFLGTNWSPSGLAVAPVACESGVVIISPSLGVADFNEKCETNFNLWPHDFIISESLGSHLYDVGFKNIAIIGSLQVWDNAQADAVKKGFERSGGIVSEYLLVQPTEQDFRNEVTKIVEADVEAVVMTNLAGNMHLSAKRLKESGVDAPFFSVAIDNDAILAGEGAFEGTTIITSFTPSSKFTTSFVSVFSNQPDIGSDSAYDAIMLLAEAIETTGSEDPMIVADYINSLETWQGESGFLTFDGKGGVSKDAIFKIVKNNQLVVKN